MPTYSSSRAAEKPGESGAAAGPAIHYTESWLPAGAVLFVLAALLVVSWQRWTSPIIDSGREMDLPLRLLQGEVLYRDIHYIYPPLSPYFNALLYRLFGAHLSVLHLSGFLGIVTILLLCWRIARRFLSTTETSLAIIAILLWCLLRPEGNLIMPYSFAALHGLVLSLASLLLTLRISEGRHTHELMLNGVLIGVCALTKQEFAITAAITATAGLLYNNRHLLTNRHHRRSFFRDLFLTFTPSALIAVPVYGFLLGHFGWRMMVTDCHLFLSHLPASLVYYNQQRTGLNHPLTSLLHIIGATAVSTAFAALMTVLSLTGLKTDSQEQQINRRASIDRRRLLIRSLLLILTGLVCGLSIYLVTRSISKWDGSPLRALPVLLFCLLLSSWRRGIQGVSSPAFSRNRALFIVTVYAVAALFRVMLRVPGGGAFGGFFLPVSLLLIFYAIAHVLPRFLEDITQSQRLAMRARRTGLAALTILMIVTLVVFSVRYRRNFSVPVSGVRGTLYAPAEVAQAVNEALEFLQQETAPHEAIGIFPEGSDLAFLSGRRMPMRHQILLPDFLSEQDEREAINKLEQENVRYLLVVNRRVIEFGKKSFGNDHYLLLGNWIRERFRPVRVCGSVRDLSPEPGDARFFIRIYARAIP